MNAGTPDAHPSGDWRSHTAVSLGLSIALSAGLLDIAFRLFMSPVVDATTLALAPVVATAAFVWVVSAISAAILVLLTRGRLRPTYAFPATSVFWGLVVPITSFCCPVGELLPNTAPGWFALLLAALLAAFAGARTHSALTAAVDPSHRRMFALAPLALPLVSAAVLLWVSSRCAWRSPPPIDPLFLNIMILAVAAMFVYGRAGRSRQVDWTTRIATILPLLAVFLTFAQQARPQTIQAASQSADELCPVRRVIILSVDTLRADALSCYGGDTSTPNIDAIAREAFRFERAISPAPWTLPAFVSIMTGVYPAVHGATEFQSSVPLDLTTLAERFQAAGYYTAAIGDNAFLARDTNMSQGFVEYHFASGMGARPSFGLKLLQQLFPSTYVGVATSRSLTNMACEWVGNNADRSFFLWLHYFDPHLPYAPPPQFMPTGAPPASVGVSLDDRSDVLAGHLGRTVAEREWIRELYLGEVRYVDACIGEVVAALERLGLYDDTLLLFVSDHGEEFWEHGGFEHGHSLYDEVIHVPLLIKPPFRADGRSGAARFGSVSATVSTAAITPTVLDLCGISYDRRQLSVSSLAPLLGGEAVTPDVVYSDSPLYYEDRRASLAGDTKYIWNALAGTEEVYDLISDPEELSLPTQPSDAALREGRTRCDDYLRSSRRLREALGLVREKAAQSAGRLEQLRSLGYVR